MTTITGTVDKIDSRTVKTKFGPKPVYDLFVNGRKYGYGFKNPQSVGIQPGVTVEFVGVDANGYTNVDVDTIKVVNGSQGTPPTRTSTSNNRSSGGMGFPVDTTSDKFAIIRQNALTNAAHVVDSYTGHFASVDEDKPTLEEYVDMVIKVAYTFTDFSSGQREVKAARKLQRNQPQAVNEDLNKAVSYLISDEVRNADEGSMDE